MKHCIFRHFIPYMYILRAHRVLPSSLCFAPFPEYFCLDLRSVREINAKERNVEICSSLILVFSFTCFYLRALSYSICLSIFSSPVMLFKFRSSSEKRLSGLQLSGFHIINCRFSFLPKCFFVPKILVYVYYENMLVNTFTIISYANPKKYIKDTI